MRMTSATLAVLALSCTAFAQQPAPTNGSPSKEVQAAYERVKANIIKAADNMPSENYSYKPEPDIRTFARVVNHVTEAQLHVCGAINQAKPDALPTVPPETADKKTIVSALHASFAECDKAYGATTDTNVSEVVQAGPAVKRARISLLWGNVSHDNEQYATLALYMRLKNITPPSAEK